jgi:hypothetical protein
MSRSHHTPAHGVHAVAVVPVVVVTLAAPAGIPRRTAFLVSALALLAAEMLLRRGPLSRPTVARGVAAALLPALIGGLTLLTGSLGWTAPAGARTGAVGALAIALLVATTTGGLRRAEPTTPLPPAGDGASRLRLHAP